MGEWDVVSSAPAAPAAAPAAADPWAVVSHAPATPAAPERSFLDKVNDFNPVSPANMVKSPVYGALDQGGTAVLNLLGKIAAGLHGGAQMLGGGSADTAADTINADRAALHTEATSPGAQTLGTATGAIAKPFQAVAAPIDRAIANAGPLVSTAVPAVSEATQDIASVLPAAGIARAARAADVGAAVEGAAAPTTQNALGTARGAGYKAPPSTVAASNPGESIAGTTREKIVGPSGIRANANVDNQALTTKLAGSDIGLPDAKKITAQDTANFRATGPGPKYDATAIELGTMKHDPQTVAELNRMSAVEDPASALPAKTATNVDRIAARIQTGQYTGDEWRRDISWLRENKGREAANALEDMAERKLAGGQNPQALETYKSARQDFAKSYDVQNAIGRGGQIDAAHLRDLDDKYPGLLTGNLKVIATAARELPEVTRLPGGDTGAGVHTKVQAVHNALGAVVKKIPGMNPLSDSFQTRNFGREATPGESSYVPSFGRRDQGTPSKAFELQAPEGEAAGAPRQLGMALAPGPGPREQLNLTQPEGTAFEPNQRSAGPLPPGPGPREMLELTQPEGTAYDAAQVPAGNRQLDFEALSPQLLGKKKSGFDKRLGRALVYGDKKHVDKQ